MKRAVQEFAVRIGLQAPEDISEEGLNYSEDSGKFFFISLGTVSQGSSSIKILKRFFCYEKKICLIQILTVMGQPCNIPAMLILFCRSN